MIFSNLNNFIYQQIIQTAAINFYIMLYDEKLQKYRFLQKF